MRSIGAKYILPLFLIVASSARSDPVLLSVHFGADFVGAASRVEGENGWSGEVGGGRVFGGDLVGPRLLVGVCPQISGDYVDNGSTGGMTIAGSSSVFAAGGMVPFRIGKAVAEVFMGAARITDKYSVTPKLGGESTHEKSSWGLASGMKLRFQFLDQVEAVGGYRFYVRDRLKFEGETLESGKYTGAGRGADHNFWFGVSIALGEV